MFYKVLITGDRHWDDYRSIRSVIRSLQVKYGSSLFIIEGGADGADRLAEEACRNLGVPFARVPALWDFFERAAGPIRNKVMLGLEPDEVIAFHEDLAHSKGTKNMLEQARKAGLRCRVHRGRS